MAKTEKQDATIFPSHVLGTVSPYPIVVTVIYKRIFIYNVDLKAVPKFNGVWQESLTL